MGVQSDLKQLKQNWLKKAQDSEALVKEIKKNMKNKNWKTANENLGKYAQLNDLTEENAHADIGKKLEGTAANQWPALALMIKLRAIYVDEKSEDLLRPASISAIRAHLKLSWGSRKVTSNRWSPR